MSPKEEEEKEENEDKRHSMLSPGAFACKEWEAQINKRLCKIVGWRHVKNGCRKKSRQESVPCASCLQKAPADGMNCTVMWLVVAPPPRVYVQRHVEWDDQRAVHV